MTNIHSFDLNNLVDLPVVPATNGDTNTSWVQPFADGYGADRAVYVLVLGAAANTVDFKLTQATSSGGAGAKDITGATVTQITTSTDEGLWTIEIGPGALDDLNGFTYVRAEVTVGSTDTAVFGIMYIRHRLRRPGEYDQPTAYKQSVRVY